MTDVDQPQFRSLDYYKKEGIRQLFFTDTSNPARAVSIGEVAEIIWSPSHPDTIQRNSPNGADAYRIIVEPARKLGKVETAVIQYYKLQIN